MITKPVQKTQVHDYVRDDDVERCDDDNDHDDDRDDDDGDDD